MNKPITFEEIHRKRGLKRSPGQMASPVNSVLKGLFWVLDPLFPKQEGTLPSLSWEVSITLTPEPDTAHENGGRYSA